MGNEINTLIVRDFHRIHRRTVLLMFLPNKLSINFKNRVFQYGFFVVISVCPIPKIIIQASDISPYSSAYVYKANKCHTMKTEKELGDKLVRTD